jgi:hypothetical protein
MYQVNARVQKVVFPEERHHGPLAGSRELSWIQIEGDKLSQPEVSRFWKFQSRNRTLAQLKKVVPAEGVEPTHSHEY